LCDLGPYLAATLTQHRSATMSRASFLLKDPDSFSPEEARENRETFSHQTLILTALTAINNTNHHPTFNDVQINKERVEYMKKKSTHTPVIDAATTILVTDTEILATMARGVHTAHSIVTMKEMEENDQEDKSLLDNGLKLSDLDSKASIQVLRQIDELLPNDIITEKSGPAIDTTCYGDVFFSFPNINIAVLMQKSTGTHSSQQSSTSNDTICVPIAMDSSYWAQIWESSRGFILDPK
jgi:hypothetical protein